MRVCERLLAACVYVGIPCDSSRDVQASAEFPDMQDVMATMSPIRGFTLRYGIYAHIANIFCVNVCTRVRTLYACVSLTYGHA